MQARFALAIIMVATFVVSQRPARATVRPTGVSCIADGYWVGLQHGNSDLNLFYDHNGPVILSNGCHASDQPLYIPDNQHAVPPIIEVGPNSTAYANDPITIDYWGISPADPEGLLLVGCTDGYVSEWKTCPQGSQSGTLVDNGFDITMNGGNMFVAPGGTVNMDGGGIYVTENSADLPGDLESAAGTFTGLAGTSSTPGSWGGIDFQSGTTGTLADTTIAGAGATLTESVACSSCSAAVLIEGNANISITASTVENSAGNGTEVTGTTVPDLSHDDFSYCTTCGYPPNVNHPVQFDQLPRSFESAGSSPSPLLSELSASGYGVDVIDVSGGTLSSAANWPDPGLPYLVSGDLTVGSSATLRIEAGVSLLMDGGLMVDDGTMTILGTPMQPVVLTSANDTPGGSAAPKPGDWGGLTIEDGSSGSVSYAEIKYAGAGGTPAVKVAGLTQPMAITYSTILDSAGDDVDVDTGAAAVLQRDVLGQVPLGHVAVSNTECSSGALDLPATPNEWIHSGAASAPSTSGCVVTAPYVTHETTDATVSGDASASILGSLGAAGSFGASGTGGAGAITVDQLDESPATAPNVSPPGTPSAYFDARTWDDSTYTNGTIQDCDVAPNQVLLYMPGQNLLEPGDWTPFPHQSNRNSDGCITVNLSAPSNPSLDALRGQGLFVTDGLVPTTFAVKLSSNATIYGQSVDVSVSVSAGLGVPSGSVTLDGAGRGQSVPLKNGKAEITLRDLPPTHYSLTAKYIPTQSTPYAESTSTPMSLTVNRAPLTVTVVEQIPYTTAPVVTGLAAGDSRIVYSGFVGSDTRSAIAGKLSCSTTATSKSLPGVYPVSHCSGLSAPDYAITYGQSTVTITPVKTSIVYKGWSTTGKAGSFSTTAPLTRKKPAYFEVYLATVTGKPVAERDVSVVLGSGKTAETCLSLTVKTGIAVCAMGKLTVADGTQPLTISFAGDVSDPILYTASATKTTTKVTG